MAKYFTKALIILCLVASFTLSGCSRNKEELPIKKIEISKITFNDTETFDIDKMQIERTWTLNDNKSMKMIWNKSVTGTLEPRSGKPIDKDYSTYYVRIFYIDNSLEEWIFWLDNQFSKDGAAENKENKGIYKLLSKHDVVKIGQLLKK